MQAKTFDKIRSKIEKFPVIDCHEHTIGPAGYPRYKEPIAALIGGYFQSDLMSAGAEADMEFLCNADVPTEQKWPLFERFWRRTEHTGYAHVTKWVLRNVYGVGTLSLESLQKVGQRLLDLSDPAAYKAFLDKHGVRCRLVDLSWWGSATEWRRFLAREQKIPAYDRILISLPAYHNILSHGAVLAITQRTGRNATNLDEYLDVCREQFQRFAELGAVGFKDQSAYGRGIAYDNPPRAEAERLFNLVMEDPRRSLGWPEAKPLDDFLFHEFMRMARDLGLPVQIHTGHMAGIRNEIAKTNAVLFTKVLELHRDVKFDLFHGNWPYAGEWLYLGKNYPNVTLDCCWLHIIDPRYARRVLADALVTVPHAKVHGFGGDYGDSIEMAAAHLAIARDNIAAALAEMVETGWLDTDDALQVAADWLFNNPNETFKLGFERIEP